MKRNWLWGFATGVCFSAAVGVAYAQSFTWTQQQVTPIVLVKPEGALFVPAVDSRSMMTWTKDKVVPVIEVNASGPMFEPTEEPKYLNSWFKEQVRPIVKVRAQGAIFVIDDHSPLR